MFFDKDFTGKTVEVKQDATLLPAINVARENWSGSYQVEKGSKGELTGATGYCCLLDGSILPGFVVRLKPAHESVGNYMIPVSFLKFPKA